MKAIELDMKFLYKSLVVISSILLFASCSAFKTSMTPTELYATLPAMTTTKFLQEAEVQKLGCTCLTKNRNYTAPMGLTVKHDLKNAAKGIDEWVQIDKGNAYVLKNYKWITVNYDAKTGSTATQLYVEFDTYSCK